MPKLMQISTPARQRSVTLLGGAALLALAACGTVTDYDLRGMGPGFTTEGAVQTNNRPAPDARGVISYPTYQVAVARSGDTVASIATRLGLDPNQLAAYNGLQGGTSLRAGEILALPSRVSDGGSDITSIAGAAIDRAGTVTTSALPPAAGGAAAPAATTTAPAASTPFAISEPIRHQVARGETAYIIARRYNVPVRSLAEWNGLDSNMTIREGQYLMIPTANGNPPAGSTTSEPGQGSPTPIPPSSTQPLPREATTSTTAAAATTTAAAATAAPNLGSQQTSASQSSALQRPVAGNIIRAYAKGRNEGIDIGAAAGTNVSAAAAGTVAAITTNTEGVQIVVIRHDNNLMTVYTHLDNLTVSRGASVTRGQTIGKVAAGDPSYLHFEVRRGLESVDPSTMLP
ncbi:LysM domain [Ketogulonicigenium robustum]|uniref:LysM domain n=1 Tax=Ketogulonicigenium robustum TaxID=92947 RepID=A0A1W6NYR4_9RHOB|nr:peptidoglycan DD-metalloendopeptidase family protein [Ketogulonicigenium robustum]ARO14311.1 LysM domain [Ketogulonicigenium robustum]